MGISYSKPTKDLLRQYESPAINGTYKSLVRKIFRLSLDPDFTYRVKRLREAMETSPNSDLKYYAMDLLSLPSQGRSGLSTNENTEINISPRAFESTYFATMNLIDLGEILGVRMGHNGPLKVEQILHFINISETMGTVIPNRKKVYEHLISSLKELEPLRSNKDSDWGIHTNRCARETKELLKYSNYPRVLNLINTRDNCTLPPGKGGEVLIPFQVKRTLYNRSRTSRVNVKSPSRDERISHYDKALKGIPFSKPDPTSGIEYFEKNGIGILKIQDTITQTKILLAVKDYVNDLQRTHEYS